MTDVRLTLLLSGVKMKEFEEDLELAAQDLDWHVGEYETAAEALRRLDEKTVRELALARM